MYKVLYMKEEIISVGDGQSYMQSEISDDLLNGPTLVPLIEIEKNLPQHFSLLSDVKLTGGGSRQTE